MSKHLRSLTTKHCGYFADFVCENTSCKGDKFPEPKKYAFIFVWCGRI